LRRAHAERDIHIPMHLIPVRAAELPKDKDLVIYCRSGARSYHTCQFLVQQGYDKAVNLRGGIIAWARHGYEIGQISDTCPRPPVRPGAGMLPFCPVFAYKSAPSLC
jgi:hypothetical protein